MRTYLSHLLGIWDRSQKMRYKVKTLISYCCLSYFLLSNIVFKNQWIVQNINVTEIFRKYQREVLKTLQSTGLTWDNTYEILWVLWDLQIGTSQLNSHLNIALLEHFRPLSYSTDPVLTRITSLTKSGNW